MKLTPEQELFLEGKHGRGPKKAMEILAALGSACGAEKMVPITYAHLMPPDVMFFPYGKIGQWDRELTDELTRDVTRLAVPATIEPKFCNLSIARHLHFTDGEIKEMECIQTPATKFYEKLGVIPTYSALPFYVFPGKFGEHVSIAESISILWYNTMYGSRCERYDGVSSLAAAITGYVPLTGAHCDEHRNAEVIIRLGDGLKFEDFSDADWDAFSLASSRLCQEKRPLFVGVPQNTGVTALKHLLGVIAVESGLAILHIEGLTPEAPTAQAAFMGKKCEGEFVVGRNEMDEAYAIANTTDETKITHVLLGCPHLTMKEIRDVARELRGNTVNPGVRLTVSTTAMLLNQAEDMGYADDIRKAGGVMTSDMCIAFAGTQSKGVIATNSIKAVFFYAGFSSDGSRRVRFGSTSQCARAAVTGEWEGR